MDLLCYSTVQLKKEAGMAVAGKETYHHHDRHRHQPNHHDEAIVAKRAKSLIDDEISKLVVDERGDDHLDVRGDSYLLHEEGSRIKKRPEDDDNDDGDGYVENTSNGKSSTTAHHAQYVLGVKRSVGTTDINHDVVGGNGRTININSNGRSDSNSNSNSNSNNSSNSSGRSRRSSGKDSCGKVSSGVVSRDLLHSPSSYLYSPSQQLQKKLIQNYPDHQHHYQHHQMQRREDEAMMDSALDMSSYASMIVAPSRLVEEGSQSFDTTHMIDTGAMTRTPGVVSHRKKDLSHTASEGSTSMIIIADIDSDSTRINTLQQQSSRIITTQRQLHMKSSSATTSIFTQLALSSGERQVITDLLDDDDDDDDI